jgi:hypothetical protein
MRTFPTSAVLLCALAAGCSNQADPPTQTIEVPTPTPLQPTEWCFSVVPRMSAFQEQITNAEKNPDGSKVNMPRLNAVVNDLKHDEEVAPPEFQPKITTVRRTLEDLQAALIKGGKRNIDLEAYRAASISIVTTCGKHIPKTE